jgi:hypothetical protein
METGRFQRWWLGACVVALILATWAGGFSLLIAGVFIVIFLTGVALIRGS